ncbi:MADS-box transcription factor 23-like [Coffea eugenioides]|uniref:MADS-box transcription factor 23-like n=1 Tax=Coffea eugenioides TaxID=49369 RepID=UPI000F5CF2FE|nr:MADS-box transcription factor 23-like [Coffea arabica]XP_027088500.1 MADS-box transcription factor 23-like [Coffea arabica]XP_027183985.1 MADS-box transcription factor 23-like [Coffea eugenioides]
MGKRKLEVKKIEDKKKQRDTFEARQQGLFKKARQLVQLYDAGVALITISETGKISEYGNPTLDSILQRYQEAKKGEAAAKASNDVQPQAENLPKHDADETEESPDDDDQNTSDQEI